MLETFCPTFVLFSISILCLRYVLPGFGGTSSLCQQLVREISASTKITLFEYFFTLFFTLYGFSLFLSGFAFEDVMGWIVEQTLNAFVHVAFFSVAVALAIALIAPLPGGLALENISILKFLTVAGYCLLGGIIALVYHEFLAVVHAHEWENRQNEKIVRCVTGVAILTLSFIIYWPGLLQGKQFFLWD